MSKNSLLDPPAVIESSTRRADEVKKRVEQIDTSLTLSRFELGDIFAEIKASHYYRDYGYESFTDYVKNSGVDISPRQAEYEVRESVVSKALNISKASRAKSKSSKNKEIFSLDYTLTYMDPTTLQEEKMGDIMVRLVEEAPSRSLVEIKAIVKRLKGEEEEEPGDLTWLNLPVRRDAKEIVEQAIEVGRAVMGLTIDTVSKEEKDMSTAAVLEKIAADFLASPDNQVDEFTNDTQEEFEDNVEEEE